MIIRTSDGDADGSDADVGDLVRGSASARSRMIGISGTTANQAKKQMKNASHVMWNARICGVLKLNRSIRVAFWDFMALGSAG